MTSRKKLRNIKKALKTTGIKFPVVVHHSGGLTEHFDHTCSLSDVGDCLDGRRYSDYFIKEGSSLEGYQFRTLECSSAI